MQTKRIITFTAAAELAGVQPPAIWRAIREGRIIHTVMLMPANTTTRLIDFDSLLAAYDLLPLSKENQERLDTWTNWAPTIISALGDHFLLLDDGPPFVYRQEGNSP